MVVKCLNGSFICCDKHDFRFAEHTTCHGFSRFCNTWNIFRRTLWFIFVIFCVIGLGLVVFERFRIFLNFEIKTEISKRNEIKLTLPAVTICNMNMFSSSRLEPVDEELLSISSSLISWITGVNQTIIQDQKGSYSDSYWDKVAKYEKLEQEVLRKHNITSFAIDSWITEKGWQIKNLSNPVIIECFVGKLSCSEVDFKPALTPQGLCYTINGVKTGPRYRQNNPGSESGFSILLDINQFEYTAYKLDSSKQFECGVKVLLHEPGDRLYTGTNLAQFVGVPPGVVGYISAISNERNVSYEPPFLSCNRDLNNPKRTCLASCTARDTLEKCNCRLWFEKGEAPLCGVARTTACLAFKESTSLLIS